MSIFISYYVVYCLESSVLMQPNDGVLPAYSEPENTPLIMRACITATASYIYRHWCNVEEREE
jgi:hypothetical protein